jgi:UDP-N-acetylmuramoyl-tripeptide--D-alanyl-D-alanine ligase
VRFSSDDVARITGGEVFGPPAEIDRASIDSRSIGPGALFVPVIAERNGHDFIEAALDAGATAYLSSEPARRGTAIVVDDTERALAALGSAARDRLEGRHVVGVTGSVGKTSVKDLIRSALAPSLAVHANPASFNNELGLPLTLVNTPGETDVCVLEMGARGQGHIAQLCAIGRPTIGVVTRVAGAHTELLGDLDGVARAKGELVEALPATGTAVLNADDHRVAAMARRTAAEVITFGESGDVAPVRIELDQLLRPSFELRTPAGSARLTLPLAGAHMALNAAAAVAVGLSVGVDLSSLIEGLETASVSQWRMDVTTTDSGAVVINDAYNANPTSVRAALAALAALDVESKIAVLGVMAELGDEHAEEHRAVASEGAAAGIRVIAVAAPEYGDDAEHVADLVAAAGAIGILDQRHAVLVKGSRVAGLERLAAILNAAEPQR